VLNGVEIPFPQLVNHCFLGTESLAYLWVMETGLSISSHSEGTGQQPVREINDMPLSCHIVLFFIPKYSKAQQQDIHSPSIKVTAYRYYR